MTKEEFCKRLKDINLTQKEFSEITNVPYSTLNNWNKKCEFYCNGGYNWNGYACVLPAKKCTGSVPANAQMYFGDDMELTVDTPYVYAASNDIFKKCEFYCNSGYTWTGNACIL